MAATAQTQGFLGGVLIGGKLYTVRANPQFRMSRNIDVTSMIGTGYPYLYSEGVKTPSVSLSIVPRDRTESGTIGNPVSSTFLGYFLKRYNLAGAEQTTVINDPVFETANIGTLVSPAIYANYAAALAAGPGIVFSDGESIVTMFNCKAESIRISTAKGQDLMIDCTFVGTHADVFRRSSGAVTATDLQSFFPSASDCARPLRFSDVKFEAPYNAWNEKIFGLNLSYGNNHSPNMGLDGTQFPVAQNAGMANGSLSLTLQGLDDIPGDWYGTISAFGFKVAGATGSQVFSMPNPVNYNPYDRSAPMGRVLRNYNYTLLGTCSAPNTMTQKILNNTATSW